MVRKSDHLHGMTERGHSYFSWWSLHSTEGPGLTHVTENGNYITTTMPTCQLINVSVIRHSTGSSEGHKRRDSPLFSRNLPAVLSSIRGASSGHNGFKRGKIQNGED